MMLDQEGGGGELEELSNEEQGAMPSLFAEMLFRLRACLPWRS